MLYPAELQALITLVGTSGFEPPTSCSQGRRAKPGCATSRSRIQTRHFSRGHCLLSKGAGKPSISYALDVDRRYGLSGLLSASIPSYFGLIFWNSLLDSSQDELYRSHYITVRNAWPYTEFYVVGLGDAWLFEFNFHHIDMK